MELNLVAVRLARPGAGLLVDLDGTLVRSEAANQSAFRQYFSARGWDVPDDVVYKFVKTMYHEKPELVKILAAFKGYDPQHMARPHPMPYHPGAIKFYKEAGLWPPK